MELAWLVTVLILINALIFLMLAILHFYWAAGGRWGVTATIPTHPNGSAIFSPSIFATLVVGAGLSALAVVHLINAKLFLLEFTLNRFATIGIGIIFFIRAIGDFKWVGLFKTVRETPFGRNDKKYYVPLCLFLSFSSLLIAYYDK